MVKTLRITGVAAVAFAGVVLASVIGPFSWVHLDDRSSRQVGKILAAPGAVDRFRLQHGDKNVGKPDTPPLVKQAGLFKDILDPKLPPLSQPTQNGNPTLARKTPAPPVSPAPKFALIGTSYSPSNPESSFAYVRFMDNTYQWIPCGGEAGQLVVKEVKEGSIVCWDGRRESEILIEAVPDRATLLETDSEAPAPGMPAIPQPVGLKVTEHPTNPPVPPQSQATAPTMSDDEQEALADLANKLRKLPGGPGDAEARRLISEFKSSRVSPQETRRLETFAGEPNTQADRIREKQDLLKRLNAARSSKN